MNTSEWPDFDENDISAEERAKVTYEAQVASIREVKKADFDYRHEREGASEDARIASDKASLDASIAENKSQFDTYNSWASGNRNADIANLQSFYDSVSDIATSSIDRARAGADLVQKASAAIATLYTGALALVFSVTDNPLPMRGVLAPVFLGLAVVLSTAYIAYLGPINGLTPGPEPVLGLEPKSFQRLNALIRVSSAIATRRSRYLRSSVVALGVGLIFIVLPFVSFSVPEMVTASPDSLEWPTPPTNGETELLSILYDAQVQEVAAAREAPTSEVRQNDIPVLMIGLVVGLLAVAFVPNMLPTDK